jgi:thioredoxin 1
MTASATAEIATKASGKSPIAGPVLESREINFLPLSIILIQNNSSIIEWKTSRAVNRGIMKSFTRMTGRWVACAALVWLASGLSPAQTSAAVPLDFPPLTQWENAVRNGDSAGVLAFFSTNPSPRLSIGSGKNEQTTSTDAEVSFWKDLKVRHLKVDVTQFKTPQTGVEQLLMQIEVKSGGPKPRTIYITEGQVWEQHDGQWKIVVMQRSEPRLLQQPLTTQKNIYPPGVDARAEIRQALAKAGTGHKRVILVFGANWCYDCHVLDLAFLRPDLAPVLSKNFEVVHVDVGEGDKNQDLMAEYQVSMSKGIPALAVLDNAGKLLYSQKEGEFERARALTPDELLQFFNRWKPQAR